MGRRNQDISFYHSIGINHAVSEFQANIAEAMDAQNIYFKDYGQYSAFCKRKGRTRINSSAVSASSIRGIYPFNFGSALNIHYYSEDGKLNSLNITTGAVENLETGFSTTVIPDNSILGNKHFLTAPAPTMSQYVPEADWDAVDATGIYDTVTLSSYGGTAYDAGYAAPGIGSIRLLNHTSVNLTGKIMKLYVAYLTEHNTTPIPSNFEEEGVQVRLFSADGYKEYTMLEDVNGIPLEQAESDNAYAEYDGIANVLTSGTYIQLQVDVGRDTATTTFGSFDPTAVTGILVTITSAATGALVLGGVGLEPRIGNLVYAEDSTGYRRVADANCPEGPVALAQYDGRIWAADGNYLTYSTTGDGTDWTTDSSNFEIDDGDGDIITALKPLGQQLIVFKKHSVHRIQYTGNDAIPYRRIGVYSGGASESSVGCVSKETVRHLVLESTEYLIFCSSQGLYSISELGNPVPIDNRIKEDLDAISEAYRKYSFAVVHPEKRQYWLAHTLGSVSYSDQQFVYGADTKAWSKYTFTGITSFATLVDSAKTYILMGDKNGFLYKHDYQTTTAANDWRDQGSDAEYSAINAYWQTHLQDFSLPARYKTAMELEIVADPYYAGDITWTVTNEESNTSTGVFNITPGTSLNAWEVHRVTTGLYGKYLQYKFSNANSAENMEIKLWSACIKPSGAA